MHLLALVIPMKREYNIFLPSKNFDISYCYLSKLASWYICSLPWYLTPKYTNTRVKHIGLCLCFHKPGMILLCTYPCFDKHSSKNVCAKIPACGNPYIPYTSLNYTHPSFVAFSLSPYYSMKYSGKLLSFNQLYLYCAMGVLR